MKTTKISLANIQGKLSRAEMKNIMAGSNAAYCGQACFSNDNCTNSSMCKTCGTDRKCL